jgi:hypothetical protein
MATSGPILYRRLRLAAQALLPLRFARGFGEEISLQTEAMDEFLDRVIWTARERVDPQSRAMNR